MIMKLYWSFVIQYLCFFLHEWQHISHTSNYKWETKYTKLLPNENWSFGVCNFYKQMSVHSTYVGLETIMKLYWSFIIHYSLVCYILTLHKRQHISHTLYYKRETKCTKLLTDEKLKLKPKHVWTISLICFASDLNSYPLSNLQIKQTKNTFHLKLPMSFKLL